MPLNYSFKVCWASECGFSQEKLVVDLELDVADHVGVAKTDWQCESGDTITVDPEGAVLIESVLPFLVELARYLEHGGAGRWSLEEMHSMVKSEEGWVPVIDVFVFAIQNMGPDLIAQLAWKA